MIKSGFRIGIQTDLTLEEVTLMALLYHVKWVLRVNPKPFISFVLEIHDIYR